MGDEEGTEALTEVATQTSLRYLAVKLLHSPGLEVQPRKGQDEVTHLGIAVFLTVCCEVLVRETRWKRTI